MSLFPLGVESLRIGSLLRVLAFINCIAPSQLCTISPAVRPVPWHIQPPQLVPVMLASKTKAHAPPTMPAQGGAPAALGTTHNGRAVHVNQQQHATGTRPRGRPRKASNGVVSPVSTSGTKERRGGGSPRGSPNKRGKGRGANSKNQASPIATFAGSISRPKLLQHAEEIQLARQVQRLLELERVYVTQILTHTTEAPVRVTARRAPLAAEATAAITDSSDSGRVSGAGGQELEFAADWAKAVNVSVDTLQHQLADGLAARDKIVSSNVGLVHNEVFKLKRSCGGRLDRGTTEQDLIQEGCISLLRAAEKFDVGVGVRFSTYATFWVRAAIRRALQEQTRSIRLPARVQAQYNKIRNARSALAAASNYRPTEEQVVEHLAGSGLALTPAKVREITSAYSTRPSSLDAVVTSGVGDSKSLLDIIEDPDELVEEDVALNMLKGHLAHLFSKYLNHEEAKCISIRFGLEDGQSHTVKATAEKMGVTYAHTKKLLFSAMSKLRRPHVAAALREYMDEDSL